MTDPHQPPPGAHIGDGASSALGVMATSGVSTGAPPPPPQAPPQPAAQPAIPPPKPAPKRRATVPQADGSGPRPPMERPDEFDSRATRQAGPRSPMMSSLPPTAASIPAPSPLPGHANKSRGGSKRLVLWLAASLFGVMILVLSGLGIHAAASGGSEADGVVRIVTPDGRGTGFFVEGPDDHAYVATAFHVVDGGESILVERSLPGDGDERFTEAYPEVEVVAFDADADLAVLRIRNVSGDRFPKLELAEDPKVNAEIKAYGYPASALTSRTGLLAKDGKLLSVVKFPVHDRRLGRVVRDNAVPGLLVSVDVEPGFSGGPTLDEDGEVVGVTVSKDRLHRGQNGAVHVERLRELLASVEPSDEIVEPTPEQVADLLERIEKEYLLLPTGDRLEEREHAWIAASELPRLRGLIDAFRRHERDTSVPIGAKLSGRAALGMWAAQMPGQPLTTYRSKDVQEQLQACERARAPMQGFFGDTPGRQGAAATEMRACDELALRPLAWDLLAATLQWTGTERSYEVTKLERADSERPLYEAKVRVSGHDALVPLWVGVDYGELRIKLFDKDGELYGVRQAREVDASDLRGEWRVVKTRAPSHALDNTEQESTETVSISIREGGKVTVKHVVDEHLFAAKGRRFRCNARMEVHTGLEQKLTGELDKGVILARPFEDAKRLGRDHRACSWGYRPDAMVAFKMVGERLAMYRTDGTQYPQVVELEHYAPSDDED